jgi:hypothetical protein
LRIWHDLIVQLNIGGMRSTQTAGTLERYRHSCQLVICCIPIQYVEVGFADPHGSASINIAGSVSESRRAKITRKKEKSKENHVLKCWMFSFEG